MKNKIALLPLWIIDLNTDTRHRELLGERIAALKAAVSLWRYSNVSSEGDFAQVIVKEGQQFIHQLNTSGNLMAGSLDVQICIIGSADNAQTQRHFALAAELLRENRSRILPQHVHQGITITGMLFIPCELYMRDSEVRNRAVALLREIDEKHTSDVGLGYDHLILCQDDQLRTERCYPMLTPEQLEDFTLQCLVHMYYVTDAASSLFPSVNDDGFMSIGVSSAYYDTRMQDYQDRKTVFEGIITALQSQPSAMLTGTGGEDRMVEVEKDLMTNLEALTPEATISRNFSDLPLSFNDIKPAPPSLDPVSDWLNGDLKTVYYEDYLCYYPANLMACITSAIESRTSEFIVNARRECVELFENYEKQFYDNVIMLIRDASNDTGVAGRVKTQIEMLDKALCKKREKLSKSINENIWARIALQVKGKEASIFREYHRVYASQFLNSGVFVGNRTCETLRTQALENLAKHMSMEPTVISFVARTVILTAVAFVAIVAVLGETFSPLAFVTPVLMWMYFNLYYKKRRILESCVRAIAIHDAMERIVNVLVDDIDYYYERMHKLKEQYLKRLGILTSDRMRTIAEHADYNLEIPQSMFNQPILGGEFAGVPLLCETEDSCNQIRLCEKLKPICSLTPDDYLILAQQFMTPLKNFFSSVASEADSEALVVSFQKSMLDYIDGLIPPRPYSTIGDHILAYQSQHQRLPGEPPLLDSMVRFAAVNGNVASATDTQFSDVKGGREELLPILNDQLLNSTTSWHLVPTNELFYKYIFITRWRTFRHVALNRFLS